MAPSIIQYDYDFSVYAQKTRLVLQTAGVSFVRCDQPMVLPRPDLEALGITYRRIPLLAVGKDVYCDSSRIIDLIATHLGKLPTSPADKAWETWGNTTFQSLLTVLPSAALKPDFIRDRASVFPILKRPDYDTLRGSGLGIFRARMQQVEQEFLGNPSGPFMNGAQISLADIHVIWPLRWALKQIGLEKEPGFGPDAFPKVWRLINALPSAEIPVVSAAEAQKTVLEYGEYSSAAPTTVPADDPYGIKAGTVVSVESDDAEPGAHPQRGTLVASDDAEVVIGLDNGIHLHFPRIGYFVRAQ